MSAYEQNSVVHLCWNWILFLLCMTRCTFTIQPKTFLKIPQSIQFLLLSESKCSHKFKETVASDDTLHFFDEQIFGTNVEFDCDIAFYHEAPKKSDTSTQNGKTIPDHVKNPEASQVKINITVLLMSSIFVIFFQDSYNSWSKDPAVLMSLSQTIHRDSRSNKNPHKPRTDLYPVFSSLQPTEDKRKKQSKNWYSNWTSFSLSKHSVTILICIE